LSPHFTVVGRLFLRSDGAAARAAANPLPAIAKRVNDADAEGS